MLKKLPLKTSSLLLLRNFSSTSTSRCSSNLQLQNFPPIKETMLPSGCMKHKVALVTGGGTGLGKGMATKLSLLGAKVAITSRNIEVLSKTAQEIEKMSGNQVVPIACDVRSVESIKEMVDSFQNSLGLPNIVINNAAGNFISPTERLSANAWKTIIDIVLNGTALVTLEVGKRLISSKQGCSFLNISTCYASTGSAFVVPSAAAKSGVEALTKSLAAEWGRYGIRCNGIAPGPIETKGAFSRLDPTGEFKKMFTQRSSIGRLGEIEELSNLASYLVSDFASWMSGEIVRLDGGETCTISGEFNPLLKVSNQQWDLMEKAIRKTKGS